MAYLERENGHRIYYEDYGSGDTAIVLIHGWGMNLRVWDYSLDALVEEGFRVVALDHRGCGGSDKDFAEMGIKAIAADAVALVEHLKLERVVLNGWSLGGAVAVEAASSLAQRCAGLFLTCAASPVYIQKSDFPHGGTPQGLADTLVAMSADRVNFLAAMSQGVCASEVSDDVIRWMLAIFLQASPRAAKSLAELGPLDQRATLASLEMPILSIVGAKDQVVDPEVCRSVIQYNPGARIVELENAGHAPFIDDTGRYNSELISFIRSCL